MLVMQLPVARTFLFACLLVTARGAASGTADFPGRIAGNGLNATYYLAADVDSALPLLRLESLEELIALGQAQLAEGIGRAEVEAEARRVRLSIEELLEAKRIVTVSYGTLVTALGAEQTIYVDMFADPAIAYGRKTPGFRTRVRVDDGPLQGRVLYGDAHTVVARDIAVAGDAGWLRAEGTSWVFVFADVASARQFGERVAVDKDRQLTSFVMPGGSMDFVTRDTRCLVLQLDPTGQYALVLVAMHGQIREMWAVRSMVAVSPPAEGR